MRPTAHPLSLPPPKKVSKERRPHVSDPALHCAALRCVPGKPASAMTAAARQNALCDLRSRRSDNCCGSDHGAIACCTSNGSAAVTTLAGAASRERYGPWLRSPWHVRSFKCMELALQGETVDVSGSAYRIPYAAGGGRAAAEMRVGFDMPHVASSVRQGSGGEQGAPKELNEKCCLRTSLFKVCYQNRIGFFAQPAPFWGRHKRAQPPAARGPGMAAARMPWRAAGSPNAGAQAGWVKVNENGRLRTSLFKLRYQN